MTSGDQGSAPEPVEGLTHVDETGLPGNVMIGVESSPTKPKPCGLPGCIPTSPNETVPSPDSTSLTTS